MEVKINKEIQSYSESMFLGLSMRQCGFSLAAILVAIGLYFLLKPYVGTETISWMCILGAAPFAAMGFVNYHGMTAEQLAWTWIRSELLEPKRLISEPDNLYYKLLEDTISNREKEAYVGGEPYWSWYGFTSRVEWCACFVSWCADQCGYLDSGAYPKFSGCVFGMQWFQQRGLWLDGSAEPVPGMLIFFDWATQDGVPDHVGIVERVENNVVYTVEGNSRDMCRQNQYSLGSSVILGYGMPASGN